MSWFLALVFLGIEQAAAKAHASQTRESWVSTIVAIEWTVVVIVIGSVYLAHHSMWKAKSEKDEPVSKSEKAKKEKDMLARRKRLLESRMESLSATNGKASQEESPSEKDEPVSKSEKANNEKDMLARRKRLLESRMESLSATNGKASQEESPLESRLESDLKASQERYKQMDEVYGKLQSQHKLVKEYPPSAPDNIHGDALRKSFLSLRMLFEPDLAKVTPKTEHTEHTSSKSVREDFREGMLEALVDYLDSALGTSSPNLQGVRLEDFDDERLTLLFEGLDEALENKSESLTGSSLKSHLESIFGVSQETKPQSAASSSKLNLEDLRGSSLEHELQMRERHADGLEVE